MALVMLDTSWCIEILRGHPVPETWRKHRFCISTIVETELWAGVYHSGRTGERERVEKLLHAVERLPFDSSAAAASGQVLGSLARQGRRIGDFDAQIAGHAIAAKAILATKNAKHFTRVNALKLLEPK